jgi:hypothetical protein
VRVYEVQAGDTPASIAAQDSMAGCPKCALDLVKANGHKPTVVYPNGFRTFREMSVGERLVLPTKWFDGSLDGLPKAYFAALPYPDGVTPSTLGDAAAGVLADYATIDEIVAQIGALPQMNDQEFATTATLLGNMIDQAVAQASSVPQAKDAGAAAEWVRGRALQMAGSIINNDTAAVAAARSDIQSVLLTGLDSARGALQTYYAQIQPPTPPTPAPHTTPRLAPPDVLPTPTPPTPAPEPGLSTGDIFGYGLLIVSVVGGTVYLASRPRRRRRR